MKIDREKFLAAAAMIGALGGCIIEQSPRQAQQPAQVQPQQPVAPVAQQPPTTTERRAPIGRPTSPATTGGQPTPTVPTAWPAGLPSSLPPGMTPPAGWFPNAATPPSPAR